MSDVDRPACRSARAARPPSRAVRKLQQANAANATGLSELQRAVLRYLQAHPDAADTARGIVQWWVFQELVRHRLPDVQNELDQLVRAGLLCARRRGDAETV
jgi:hypothetical protein